MRIFLLLAACCISSFLCSCKKYKPADPAFFFRAGTVTLAATPTQGTSSHKITDLWLYVNGQFQGAYPVGNLMPIVTKNQSVKIDIFPGIKNNGISDTRIPYSLYDKLEFDTLIESGVTITRPVTFQYKSSAVFTLIENFEGGTNGFNIQKAPDSDTTFYIASPEDSFEGNSIQMGLSGRSLSGKLITTIDYELPQSSPDVYLELNYKANQEFSVGLIGDDGIEKSALMISAKNEWNKIYVQLSTVINSPTISKTYKLYFKLLHNNVAEPRIFLDNIKLVHL